MPFDLDINQIFEFLETPLAQNIIFVLRIVFILLSSAMLGFIIWALIKTTWLKRMYLWDLQEVTTYRPYTAKKLYAPWQKIKLRLEAGLESEYKLAVIEADSMLDDIVKGSGFAGDTFTDRLNNLTQATLHIL